MDKIKISHHVKQRFLFGIHLFGPKKVKVKAKVTRLQSPIAGLQSPIASLQSLVSGLQSPVSSCRSPAFLKHIVLKYIL